MRNEIVHLRALSPFTTRVTHLVPMIRQSEDSLTEAIPGEPRGSPFPTPVPHTPVAGRKGEGKEGKEKKAFLTLLLAASYNKRAHRFTRLIEVCHMSVSMLGLQ